MSDTVDFKGEVLAVKGRIRLLRSFDQISHQYQGYTLVIGKQGDPESVIRVAVGPAAHAKHQFRIGDVVSGKGQPVADPRTEWAQLYKVSGLKLERRGPEGENRPPDPDGGIAPPLEVYRANGHRRVLFLPVGTHDGDRDHHRSVESVEEEVAVRDTLLWAKGLPSA